MTSGAPIRKPFGPRPHARFPGRGRPRACSIRTPASMAAGSLMRRCNACYNALDRHVEAGRGDQPALFYDSPVTGTKRTITYRRALDETATLGAVLADFGVAAGDRVLIYMPMIPEAMVAMLACARIGAVHSVVFGGFAAKELATRIDDAEPKVDPRPRAAASSPAASSSTSRCSISRSGFQSTSQAPASCSSARRSRRV